jgi:hypothetical protein
VACHIPITEIKDHQPRNLSPAKLSFKNEEETKTVSDEQDNERIH